MPYPFLQHPIPEECEGSLSGRHMLEYDEDGTFWCEACGRQYQYEDGNLVPYGQSQKADENSSVSETEQQGEVSDEHDSG